MVLGVVKLKKRSMRLFNQLRQRRAVRKNLVVGRCRKDQLEIEEHRSDRGICLAALFAGAIPMMANVARSRCLTERRRTSRSAARDERVQLFVGRNEGTANALKVLQALVSTVSIAPAGIETLVEEALHSVAGAIHLANRGADEDLGADVIDGELISIHTNDVTPFVLEESRCVFLLNDNYLNIKRIFIIISTHESSCKIERTMLSTWFLTSHTKRNGPP